MIQTTAAYFRTICAVCQGVAPKHDAAQCVACKGLGSTLDRRVKRA